MKKTLLFSITLFIATIAFAYDVQIDDIYYNLNNETKTAEITNLTGRPDTSTISYFQSNITIPEKITYNASEYSVISIGNNAFCNCPSLTSITIPNSITSIGDWAFSYCTSLTSITIPNGVTSIGNYAFYYCSSLKSITIPNDVTSIGDYAFSSCSSLVSITIPNSVTSIGRSAFSSCSSLVSITIPNSVTSIGKSAFSNCSSLSSITIPNNVTSIGDYAFYYCSSLTSITIPNSITSIGSSAFKSCSSLTSVIWNAKKYNDFPSYNYAPFYDIREQITLFTLGDSVEHIPTFLCYYMDKLTSITIPNSVTSIGSSAFQSCSSLTSITIPNSVTSIGSGAFQSCSSLDTLICNCNNNLNITTNSIFQISTLRYLTAPAVAFNTFREENQTGFSNKLTEVHITDGKLNENGFNFINRSYKSLHTIDLASATNTTINDLAFYDCYKLENLTLPKNVETIGYKAFAECVHIKQLEIPTTVTNIEERAFENCRSINTLTFEEGSQLESIGSWAFYNNHALESVELPEGVKEIGDAAFYGCNYVEEIVIPASVQRIGDNGFALCNQVKRMEVRATTPPTIEAKTFHQVSRNIEFIVPAEARDAYAEDEYWREFIQEAPTNVENTIEGIEIYTQNGTLHLEGLTADYQIYNMSGQMVYSGNATTIDLAKGIYIIRTNDKSQKIVL